MEGYIIEGLPSNYRKPSSPEEWAKAIKDVQRQIGPPNGWTMDDYNMLQDILNEFKAWRALHPEVIDHSNEPNEYVVPLPSHLHKGYDIERAKELGYKVNKTGHLPSVDNQTGMWLKSMDHPTAWKEYMYGQLNKDIGTNTNVVVNPEGHFGDKQLQYIDKKKYRDGGGVGNYLVNPWGPNNPYSISNIMQRDWNRKLNQSREEQRKKDIQKELEKTMLTDDGKPYEYKGKTIKDFANADPDDPEAKEFLLKFSILP